MCKYYLHTYLFMKDVDSIYPPFTLNSLYYINKIT